MTVAVVTPEDAQPPAALELRAIRKQFGSTRALDRAHLAVRTGTVHALLGENGAGKTTLMRIAYGMLRPDAGELWVGGRAVHFRSAADAIAENVGMVHQHYTNVAAMTVAENVALGGTGRFDRVAAATRVRALGAETGLGLDPDARAGALTVGAQQRLEIVKALAREARVLILDEPTAVLAPAEAEDLLAWLRSFADSGRAVVLITHKLREALAIADDVTVLRRGRTVLSVDSRQVDATVLAAAMIGDAPPRAATPPATVGDAIAVRLEGITVTDDRGLPALVDATLTIRSGEIVGVAGVENSGHHLLLRAIAGRVPISGGSLERHGSVAFIPEDRQRDGLVLAFTLTENIALKGAGRRRGRLHWPQWRATTNALLREYDVRAARDDMPASSLSGGNQQKLVLARELSDAPSLIVAENPTRGLDIRATADVHDRLREAAVRGMAVVVYSSDLDEVLSFATRVVAVHAGRLKEVSLDRAQVGRAILGLS